jgi:hypothetical protein
VVGPVFALHRGNILSSIRWDNGFIDIFAFSLKGTAVRRGLEHGSREKAIVRNRYQATASEDTAGWKRLSVCSSGLYSIVTSRRCKNGQ